MATDGTPGARADTVEKGVLLYRLPADILAAFKHGSRTPNLLLVIVEALATIALETVAMCMSIFCRFDG